MVGVCILFIAYFQVSPVPSKAKKAAACECCTKTQVVYHQQPEVSPVVVSNPTTTDDEFPLSLPLLTKFAALMMTSILLYCGYNACQSGEFECDMKKLPDISHVMGHAPLNKLYAIMLTFYSFQKQAYVRAFHQKLSPLEPSKCTYMLYFAIASCVFGPMIGFFDVYYNMTVHCTVTAIFTIGELGYIFTIIGICSSNRKFFADVKDYTQMIDRLEVCRMFIAVEAVVSLGSKYYHYDIAAWGAIIEWSLFICTFYIFTVLADLMPYQSKVVKDE